jgi:hypothetical protein
MMEDRRSQLFKEKIKYYIIIEMPADVNKKEINANRKAVGLPSLEYQDFKRNSISN